MLQYKWFASKIKMQNKDYLQITSISYRPGKYEYFPLFCQPCLQFNPKDIFKYWWINKCMLIIKIDVLTKQ